jgi:hypothetical protein
MNDKDSINDMQMWIEALTALENGERVQINAKDNRKKELGWIPLGTDEFEWPFLESLDVRIVEQEKEWVNLYDCYLGTKRYASKKEAMMEGRGSSFYIKTMRLTDD